MLSLDVFLQYTTLFLEIQVCVLFPPSKAKSITITQPLNQFTMGKCGLQSTKVVCCNRFSFLLSIYNVNIFNDKINILEYPEFAVIKKEFRFTMKIFYLGVNKFKYIGNCFGQRLR